MHLTGLLRKKRLLFAPWVKCSSLLGCSGGCIFNGISLSWLIGSAWSRAWRFFLGCRVGPFMKAVLWLRIWPLTVGLDDLGAPSSINDSVLLSWYFEKTWPPMSQEIKLLSLFSLWFMEWPWAKPLASSYLTFPSAVDVKTASHESYTKIRLLSKDFMCSEVSVAKY